MAERTEADEISPCNLLLRKMDEMLSAKLDSQNDEESRPTP